MSKNFVTVERFKDELKGVNGCIDELFSKYDKLSDRLDVCKDAININSDGCQELESTVNELSKRLEKAEKAIREYRAQAVRTNDKSGTAIAVVLSITALVALIAIGNQLDKLELRVLANERNKTTGSCKCEKPVDKPFCADQNDGENKPASEDNAKEGK